MLFTYVHQKEYTAASHDVAHLYEHFAIHSFYRHLESHGIQPGLIGYVNGDTFEGIIFLHALFYDQHVASLYEKFLSKPLAVDNDLMSHVLCELETEDRINLTFRDTAAFNQQFKSLIAAPWVNNDSMGSSKLQTTELPASPLETKKKAKDFRDISLGVYAENSGFDDNDRTLFLRLSVIIGDIVHLAVRQKLHSAAFDISPTVADDSYIGNTYKLRLKSEISLALIKTTALDKLRGLDINSAMSLISAHFDEFATHSSWRDVVIDYYRHTGIVTSNAHISSLATPERIAAIISKLKIHARTIHKEEM
jgi:hypothetical protein